MKNFGTILLPEFEATIKDGETSKDCIHVSLGGLIPFRTHTTSLKDGGDKWGPVISTRMSNMIKRDGKLALIKAREIKQVKNLEIPRGNKPKACHNYFAYLDNSNLVSKALKAGIALGDNPYHVVNNVEAIKKLELDRLGKFKEDNPDMLLPGDIDVTKEDYCNNYNFVATIDTKNDHNSDPHMEMESDDAYTWIEAKSQRSKKCQAKISTRFR